ncbi:hypothetical protein [uncultured Rhodoblastus sp.]|uniref:hypothetical protein n=1 Tax=uncultured Rhodoblastus sp. TaxID=543037 RepID=UPI0025D9AB1F|nr:hypothetical protein [uncultured Rhodoblastus sp.]
MNSTIIITCGATTADIRQELGSRCGGFSKLKPHDPRGIYGDFILNVTDEDAAFYKMKYPKVVRSLP